MSPAGRDFLTPSRGLFHAWAREVPDFPGHKRVPVAAIFRWVDPSGIEWGMGEERGFRGEGGSRGLEPIGDRPGTAEASPPRFRTLEPGLASSILDLERVLRLCPVVARFQRDGVRPLVEHDRPPECRGSPATSLPRTHRSPQPRGVFAVAAHPASRCSLRRMLTRW